MLEFPVFLVSLIGQTALTGQTALIGRTALIGPGLSDVGSSHVFLGSGDALAQRSLFSGWWAQAVDPEFGEAVMVQSGAQTRNSEEGPSSSRMQEKAAGNHGMQGALGDGGGAGGVESGGRVSPGPADTSPPNSPGRLLARTRAGRTMGGRKNVLARLHGSLRLGLQPCEHPGTISEAGFLYVGPRLLGLGGVAQATRHAGRKAWSWGG